MKTVFKYPVQIGKVVTHEIPGLIRFFHLDAQDGKLYVWALVDTEEPIEKAEIYTCGTGWDLPDDRYPTYIGTYQSSDNFVWHAFELT